MHTSRQKISQNSSAGEDESSDTESGGGWDFETGECLFDTDEWEYRWMRHKQGSRNNMKFLNADCHWKTRSSYFSKVQSLTGLHTLQGISVQNTLHSNK